MGKDVIVTGLDHVSVTTPEELETEVLGWYGSVLGLERLDKPAGSSPGGAWFRAGDKEVHIGVDPHNPPPSAHFCLTVNDFDVAVASLRSDGCHIEQAAEIAGRRRCFTRDPAGNRLELIAFDATP